MDREVVAPPGLAQPRGHYSHGVITTSARTLYVAGQVPLDEEGNLVGEDDPARQATQVFENIREVVEAAGGKIEDIAKTTVFLVDLAHRPAVGGVRREFFTGEPPANTLLVVQSLASPDFLVEVEAIVPLES